MLSLTKQNNSIYVEGTDHSLFPYNGVVSLPLNSVIVVTDESDIVTFRSASNYDVLFSGRIDEITINGQGVTKENIGSVFGSAFNVAGGGGGLTPEQEEKLNNAVQIADYNADKEAQATIDESQNAAIEGLSGDIEGKQDKIDDLDAIREGAEKGATALQEETDPIWNAEKGNYYTKGETDGLVGEAKASANTAISIASSAEGIATAAHSRADEALEELEKKADKTWVEGKGYLTEETDPTVPQHVKDITEENIAKWNEGGKTGEVVGNNEAPKDNVGIGIFNGDGEELKTGDPLHNGDLFYMRPLTVEGEMAQIGTIHDYWIFTLNNGIYSTGSVSNENWTIFDSNMVEVENPSHGYFKAGDALYARYDGEDSELWNPRIFVRANAERGVYIYDGTEEPSKVATEKTLEGFVDVETYNKHITDQTAVDEAQNSAIEGIEGDITRIDSKIDDIELFKFPNATIIGEPTVQSGQVSNFSTENYLQFPFVLDLHNQSFQIDFCFTTSTDVSGQQNILDSKFGIALAIKDGKGLMAISSNGTSWNIGSVIGTMNIEPNTTYYARLTWDGIQYKTFLSTDGTAYTQDMVLVGAQRPFPTNIYIGGCDLSVTGHEAHPFKGTINMNKAQLTVMGNVIWQGMDDAGLATRLATNLNNIDEVGKERIKEIVGTIPTKTSELTNDSGFLTEHQSLKTINGETIVGDGDIEIKGGGSTNYLVDARPSDLQDGKGIITDLVDYVKQWVTFQSYNHNVTEEESKLKFYLTDVAPRNDATIVFKDNIFFTYHPNGNFDYLMGDKSLINIYRKSDDTLIEDFVSEDAQSIYFKFDEGTFRMTSHTIGVDKTLYYNNDKVFDGAYIVKGSEYNLIPTVNQFVKVNGQPIVNGSDIDKYNVLFQYYEYPNSYVFLVEKNGKYMDSSDPLKESDVSFMRFNKNKNTDSTYRHPSIVGNTQFSITLDDDTVFVHFDVKGCCFWFTVPHNLQYNLVSGTNIKTINGESILGSGNIEIQGGGGGEPDEYIKNAVKSEDGNTLTLTKNDDSTVVFSPSTGGGGDEKDELVSLNNYKPVNIYNGGWNRAFNGTVMESYFGIGSMTNRKNSVIQIEEDTRWSINLAFRTPSELGVSEQVLVDMISTDTSTYKWRIHVGIINEGRLRFLFVNNDGTTLMDYEGMMPDIEVDSNYILTVYFDGNYGYMTFLGELYNQKTGLHTQVLNTSMGDKFVIPKNNAKITFGMNCTGRGDVFNGFFNPAQCSMYINNKPVFRTVDKFLGQIDFNDTITLEGTLEDGSVKKFILIGIEG